MKKNRDYDGFDDEEKRYSRYTENRSTRRYTEEGSGGSGGDARYDQRRDSRGQDAREYEDYRDNSRGQDARDEAGRGHRGQDARDEADRGRRGQDARDEADRGRRGQDARDEAGRGRRGQNARDEADRGRRGYRDPYDEIRSQRRRRKKWPIVLLIILLLIVAAGAFVLGKLGEIDHEKLSNLLVNTGVSIDGGYRNIVLYGVDSREGELTKDCLSDTIMICSINKATKEVKIASVYRDTYLDNTDGNYRKATECYLNGGPSLSINMLNTNLDLNIEDYVTVNFNAMIEVVDLLGGIDLEITEEEMGYINGYCVENKEVTGVDYTPLETYGQVHLTGIQALAYCRIRYTEGWDYKRTERQRTVLNLVAQKAKQQGAATLLNIANTMLPTISTSMSTVDIISLITAVSSYTIGDETGFPFDKYAMDVDGSDVVVPQTLASNVTQLHSFLFGTSDYVPSDTVQSISSTISEKTGLY